MLGLSTKSNAAKIGALFTAAAMTFTGLMSLPQDAEASAAAGAAAAAAAASSAAASAARQKRMNDGLNSYIVAPSKAAFDKAVKNGFDGSLAPYAEQCQAELVKPKGLTKETVSSALRGEFKSCMYNEQLVMQMSAETPYLAEHYGMSDNLSPYFQQCQVDYKITPGDKDGTTLSQAKAAENCMEERAWEDFKDDVLVPGAFVLGGLGLAGLIGLGGRGKRKFT